MNMQCKKNDEFVTLMIKMVGTSCNMRCVYCYEHVSSDKNQVQCFASSSEVISYLDGFKEYQHVFVLFHGGEPLLANIQEVEHCLVYISSNFLNKYSIQFQTNGTLLNDAWINLFKKYESHISLSISLDPIGDLDLRKAKYINYRKIVEDNILKYVNELSNIGIVSVVHRYNIEAFPTFIEWLLERGIKSLTINKYKTEKIDEEPYITEMEYTEFLKSLSIMWINKGWYRKIGIQPLNSLFSKGANKLCIYLPDENKCSYFKTFYNHNNFSQYCDHVIGYEFPKLPEKCKSCLIYDLCGGGCLMEVKDNTFCEARKKLFRFVSEIKR